MNKKLKARLAAIQQECKTLVSAADESHEGVMPEVDQKTFDGLMVEAENIQGQIERNQSMADLNQSMDETDGRQVPAQSGSAPAYSRNNSQDDENMGFQNMGEFATVVQQSCDFGVAQDSRLSVLGSAAPGSPHREGGSSEGYLVPPAMRREIWQLVYGDDDSLLNDVDHEPTASNSVSFVKDQTTPWGATGIQALWRNETKQMKESTLDFEGEQLKLHELYAFVTATEELLEDAPRLASRLTVGAANAINWKATESIALGTGAGQPLGYQNSKAPVVITKEDGQAAKTILAENIAKMYSRMLPSSITRSHWRVNIDILPQLMFLTIKDRPIWTPPAEGFKGAPGGYLLGRPIRFSEHADTLGTKGDIQLIDPKGYYSPRKQGGVKFAESMHLYFDRNLKAFRWIFRLGGTPYLSKPVSPAKGTATKSHFVFLETRA